MSPTLAFLVLTTLSADQPLANLDFSSGLTHWQGEGFSVKKQTATSADTGDKGRTGILHRTFLIPLGTSLIRFSAAAVRPADAAPRDHLDVVLEAPAREIIPKVVFQGERWVAAERLLPPDKDRLREYVWNVEKHAGRRVRIALVDSDVRPGCHVVCSGFRVVSKDELNLQEFTDTIRKLESKHKLKKLTKYTSDHFLAYSNADEAYTEYRLDNCETIYPLFFKHFRRRGFEVTPPVEKMMVAVFDTQDGFEAYVESKMSSAVTGLFHTPSNRLVVYDFATNRAFMENKRRIESAVKKGGTDLDRERRIVRFGRFVSERRNDTNISTIMHEVAHQLSFNCGLLNRTGDVPLWLAEGLAVYCESTAGGAWQGIGERNPPRAAALARFVNTKGEFLSLRSLAADDNWFRKAGRVDQVILGYSQSWALFRFLMEEHPAKLKAYLKSIHPRRTPDHRLEDFAAAFGTDLEKFERRYQSYLRSIAKNESK
jgi:hypothetical protein